MGDKSFYSLPVSLPGGSGGDRWRWNFTKASCVTRCDLSYQENFAFGCAQFLTFWHSMIMIYDTIKSNIQLCLPYAPVVKC